jgi:tetratricopeptide (TPR) repeat protein
MTNPAKRPSKSFRLGQPQNLSPYGIVATLVIPVSTIVISLITPEIRCQLHLHSESCHRSIASEAQDFYRKGSTLLSLQRSYEALDSFERAIEIEPNQANFWNKRGVALEKLGKNQEAIASYEKALLLDSSHEIARQKREALLQKLSKKSS